MAVFKSPPNWGQGISYPASWGTTNMTWGGSFAQQSELRHLGIIQMDVTPSANIEVDITPSVAIRLDLTPSVDIEEK